jgi:CubicO group peptidase (beta-lactamase class C family)
MLTQRSGPTFPRPRPAMPLRIRLRPTVLALALTTLAAADAAAQTGRTLVERLDSLAGSGVLEKRAVGTVAAAVKGTDTLLFKSYGRANVEWEVPMPADAMFEIGSVTKQFTAAAILQLRDEGKLSLDDEITRWLPDFDTRGNRVTVRRLLDHTSGIVGLTEMPEFDLLIWNPRFPRDSAYALIKRYPFQFPTGTAQMYNNSAFWLAGLIIEKASGMTYGDYVEQRIFAPLGMTRSMYCNAENVPRRANGYRVQNGVIRRAPTNPHTWMPFAAGSICSTAGDLVRWVQALHGGRVLSPGSYQEMITPAKLDDGTPLRYGMGIAVGKDSRGLTYIGHGGSVTGFTAEAGWYPDAQLAVVVLMNSNGNADPGDVGGELAAELLPWQRPTVAPFTGDAAPLVGTYKGPGRGRDIVLQVTQAPQGIAVSINGGSPRPAPWIEGRTFRIMGDTFLTFRGGDLHLSGGSAYSVLKRQ